MSSAELSEWIAFFRIEPFPDWYWPFAQICAVIANVFGGKGRKAKVEDFIPKVKAAGKRLSVEESAGILGRLYRENEAAARARITKGEG
jgi:hypothetical protein